MLPVKVNGFRAPRPRVLFLTCHLPYPPISGGRRREFELLKRLGSHYDVELCVASKTFAEDAANAAVLRTFCSDVHVFGCAPAASTGTTPTQVARHSCPRLTDHVRARLRRGDVDLVHVEGFYLMQHVPDPPGVPLLLVEQNVEYLLWRQRTTTAADPQERKHTLTEYLLTLEEETSAWGRADLCGALTEDDRQMMLDAAPAIDVRLVPDGLDHASALPGRDGDELPPRDGPVLVYVGNFAYQPNHDAALFLCDVILPRIRSYRPDVSLWLVGNEPSADVRARAGEAVVVTGRVADVGPYVDAADVFVCPLRIGGGVKVKVLEALWRGKAVVTTSVGAQGLGRGARHALVVADQPNRFAAAALRLLSSRRRRRRLEREAERFARTLPTWDEASLSLVAAYDELLASAQREVAPLLPAERARSSLA